MGAETCHILKMQNPIQTYAWGSRSAIAELLRREIPASEPQAELWMGAHPKSPSKIWLDGQWQLLDRVIEQFPKEMLGSRVMDRFGATLPFLFKVLAAAEPLSIQAHPNEQQAAAGFQNENRAGISLADPSRNYKDAHPKPECICALTPFYGLCGFRTPKGILAVASPTWPKAYERPLKYLENSPDTGGIRDFFKYVMQLGPSRINELVGLVVDKAKKLLRQNDAYRWINTLSQKYPGDVGVLSPLLLNIIKLEPGEALFLPPKQLHAYLDGLGIELMANSDNVLRGGLTPKHIDVQELLKILDFHPYKPGKLTPQDLSASEGIYASSTNAFSLSQLKINDHHPHQKKERFRGPEIVIVTEGAARICPNRSEEKVSIEQGDSVFIPAEVKSYQIDGNAILYKAAVNL